MHHRKLTRAFCVLVILGVLANGLSARATDVLYNNPPAVSGPSESFGDFSGDDLTQGTDSFALGETLDRWWRYPDPTAPTWALADDIPIRMFAPAAVNPSLSPLREETSFTAIRVGGNGDHSSITGKDLFGSSDENSSFTPAHPHDISLQLSGTVATGTGISLLLLAGAGITLCSLLRRRRQQAEALGQS